MNHHISSRGRASQRGFSLVEVSLAMAIAAMALITLLGMVPQGMDTMRDAGERAIIARIHQQVLNEVQLTPFTDKDGSPVLAQKYADLRIYYDDQGEELGDSSDSSGVEGGTDHIYTARVHVLDAGSQAPTSVGGASNSMVKLGDGSTGNPYLMPIIIEVAAVSGQGTNFDWDSDGNRRKIHTYQTMVARLEKEQ